MKEKLIKGDQWIKPWLEKEESGGAVIWRYSVNKAFRNIVLNQQKIPVQESLFNEVLGLETCTFVKK